MGAGETQVIALGLMKPRSVLILDDGLARLVAQRLKLPVVGTLGILLGAKRRGRISHLEPLLKRLEGSGFRLSPKTRAAVLKLAGE